MKTFGQPTVPAASAVRDPSHIGVRAIRATDASELQRFYAGLSPESRRTRFFSVSPGLDQAQSLSFCTTDHNHQEGFVAVSHAGRAGRERIVGHLCLEPDGEHVAEVAIAVADEFQHRGVGRRLLAAGAAWARREHVGRLTATALAGNAPIHRLLMGLGLPTRVRYVGAGVAEITIVVIDPGVAA